MILQFHNSSATDFFPLRLELLGINHHQEPILRPNGLPFYQWFYCVKGKGEFIVNNNRSIITKNQGMLIYPQTSHIYQPLTPDWTVHFFGFSGSLCREILSTLQMPETGVYQLSTPDVFVDNIQKLYHLSQREFHNKSSEYSKACYDFLMDLSPCITRLNPSSYVDTEGFITTLILYMEENYHRDLSLDELAGLVGRTKEYICAVFKNAMQQTIMHYLLTIRLSHARILLVRYPEKKVGDIARLCGFESPSYFGKIFKRETGMTPETYRKRPE